MYKITEDKIPSINPSDYFIKQRPKRRVKAKTFTDCETSNIVINSVCNNSKCYIIPRVKTDQMRNSFFVRTVPRWNQLDEVTVQAGSTASFKEAVGRFY